MTRQEAFEAVGKALFGERFRLGLNVALARHHPSGPKLCLDESMIARWEKGKIDIPDWVMAALSAVLLEAAVERERQARALWIEGRDFRTMAAELKAEWTPCS